MFYDNVILFIGKYLDLKGLELNSEDIIKRALKTMLLKNFDNIEELRKEGIRNYNIIIPENFFYGVQPL